MNRVFISLTEKNINTMLKLHDYILKTCPDNIKYMYGRKEFKFQCGARLITVNRSHIIIEKVRY